MDAVLRITSGQADYLVSMLRDRLAMLDDLQTQPGYSVGPAYEEIVREKSKVGSIIETLLLA